MKHSMESSPRSRPSFPAGEVEEGVQLTPPLHGKDRAGCTGTTYSRLSRCDARLPLIAAAVPAFCIAGLEAGGSPGARRDAEEPGGGPEDRALGIAMVSPYSWAHPGGVNNHIAGLASEMILRGHSVTVIAPDRGQAPPGAGFVSAGRSIPVPANGSIANIAVLPGTRSRVRCALEEGRFDVVHVHEPLVPLVSTTAVLSAGCRVVGTFHATSEGRSLTYSAARLLERRVHRRIDSLVAVSGAARALVSSYFPGHYEVVPNGIDLSRFGPGAGRPGGFPPPGGPVVLFLGRRERRKGLEVLLEAFPEVAARVPGCRLVVAGGGYGSGSLPSVEGLEREAVTLLGYVSDEELPAVYSAADVFCAPAIGGESFGIVLLEALASGTPAVASDIPGYREVVESAGGGRLFRAGDSSSLAGALSTLLKDEEERKRLAAAGAAGVERFSWKILAPRLESIYRGC